MHSECRNIDWFFLDFEDGEGTDLIVEGFQHDGVGRMQVLNVLPGKSGSVSEVNQSRSVVLLIVFVPRLQFLHWLVLILQHCVLNLLLEIVLIKGLLFLFEQGLEFLGVSQFVHDFQEPPQKGLHEQLLSIEHVAVLVQIELSHDLIAHFRLSLALLHEDFVLVQNSLVRIVLDEFVVRNQLDEFVQNEGVFVDLRKGLHQKLLVLPHESLPKLLVDVHSHCLWGNGLVVSPVAKLAVETSSDVLHFPE